MKDTLVENLRDEIVRGDLVPGQRLRLADIATRFHVSTVPVRATLRDLEACKRGETRQAANLIHDHVAEVGHETIEYVRKRDETEGSTE